MNDSLASNSTHSCILKEDPYRDAEIFNFFLTVLISVFGLISNSLVVAVNSRIKAPTSTDVYLSYVAITDNLLILSLSLFAYRYAYYHLMDAMNVDSLTVVKVALIGILLQNLFKSMNTYTIVLVNVDRFLQVKFMAKAKGWSTPRRAHISFLIVVIGSVLYEAPGAWEQLELLATMDENIHHCLGTFRAVGGIGKNKVFSLVYGVIISFVLMYVVPLIILMVTNTTLLITVCRQRNWINSLHPESSASDESSRLRKQNEMNAIRSLLGVTIIFILLNIPEAVLPFIWRLDPKHGPVANIYAFQLIIINASTNFIIYAVASSVFRRRLRQLFARGSRSASLSSSLASSK